MTAPQLSNVAPPALPQAPDEYGRAYQDQFNNVLRLYFNRLSVIMQELIVAAQTPYNLRVAQGQVEGVTATFRSAHTTQCTTTTSTLQSTDSLYVFPVAASLMTLSSTSTLDTAASVLVEGLDSNYVEIAEVVALNGQTPVSTTKSYFRVNNLTVIVGGAVGVVYMGTGVVTLGVPANKYMSIAAGENRSASSVYTVPAGKALYITAGSISSATTGSSKYVIADFFSRVGGIVYETAKITVSSSFQYFTYDPPLRVPEKADLWTNVTSSSGTDTVAATVQGYLATE